METAPTKPAPSEEKDKKKGSKKVMDIRRGSMHGFAVKSVAMENSNRSSLRGSIAGGGSSLGGSGTKRKPGKLLLDSSQIQRDVDMFVK